MLNLVTPSLNPPRIDFVTHEDFQRIVRKHLNPSAFQAGLVMTMMLDYHSLSLWLIGTVRAQPETVISRAWVQSPDPAK